MKLIDLVNRTLTSWTGDPGNINNLGRLESATSTGYNMGNLSLYLLSIDVKENNYSFALLLTSNQILPKELPQVPSILQR